MRSTSVILLLAAICSETTAFTGHSPSKSFVSHKSALFMADKKPPVDATERGVSTDQDGKSNVWAVEPKMEIETKSSEEKGFSAIVAGVGLAAFAGAAGFILTHLPDPNQF
mmetsp:Transcript_52699/g.53083  ORF Transcript_52699/g.53083 Transcript_52699/m.53083 type:complete len:111 (-) Transcript_52699:332-664(-)|eukprot:CAMPEP_0194369074 /NCGR_PEP_ID=MMETSP0174-20130528/17332_1 /TAXON_ID=216777 /ORGANISM="Proboscia alata, Strain PI-D3" /LENGTH=110 /DNA_ID=CAMNT_0039145787 /DNA_START=72 /DNA_END=404 /DNA_ORIENTATION=-